eukprot:11448199-Alexandrium_andersonii.AAC.1
MPAHLCGQPSGQREHGLQNPVRAGRDPSTPNGPNGPLRGAESAKSRIPPFHRSRRRRRSASRGASCAWR